MTDKLYAVHIKRTKKAYAVVNNITGVTSTFLSRPKPCAGYTRYETKTIYSFSWYIADYAKQLSLIKEYELKNGISKLLFLNNTYNHNCNRDGELREVNEYICFDDCEECNISKADERVLCDAAAIASAREFFDTFIQPSLEATLEQQGLRIYPDSYRYKIGFIDKESFVRLVRQLLMQHLKTVFDTVKLPVHQSNDVRTISAITRFAYFKDHDLCQIIKKYSENNALTRENKHDRRTND